MNRRQLEYRRGEEYHPEEQSTARRALGIGTAGGVIGITAVSQRKQLAKHVGEWLTGQSYTNRVSVSLAGKMARGQELFFGSKPDALAPKGKNFIKGQIFAEGVQGYQMFDRGSDPVRGAAFRQTLTNVVGEFDDDMLDVFLQHMPSIGKGTFTGKKATVEDGFRRMNPILREAPFEEALKRYESLDEAGQEAFQKAFVALGAKYHKAQGLEDSEVVRMGKEVQSTLAQELRGSKRFRKGESNFVERFFGLERATIAEFLDSEAARLGSKKVKGERKVLQRTFGDLTQRTAGAGIYKTADGEIINFQNVLQAIRAPRGWVDENFEIPVAPGIFGLNLTRLLPFIPREKEASIEVAFNRGRQIRSGANQIERGHSSILSGGRLFESSFEYGDGSSAPKIRLFKGEDGLRNVSRSGFWGRVSESVRSPGTGGQGFWNWIKSAQNEESAWRRMTSVVTKHEDPNYILTAEKNLENWAGGVGDPTASEISGAIDTLVDSISQTFTGDPGSYDTFIARAFDSTLDPVGTVGSTREGRLQVLGKVADQIQVRKSDTEEILAKRKALRARLGFELSQKLDDLANDRLTGRSTKSRGASIWGALGDSANEIQVDEITTMYQDLGKSAIRDQLFDEKELLNLEKAKALLDGTVDSRGKSLVQAQVLEMFLKKGIRVENESGGVDVLAPLMLVDRADGSKIKAEQLLIEGVFEGKGPLGEVFNRGKNLSESLHNFRVSSAFSSGPSPQQWETSEALFVKRGAKLDLQGLFDTVKDGLEKRGIKFLSREGLAEASRTGNLDFLRQFSPFTGVRRNPDGTLRWDYMDQMTVPGSAILYSVERLSQLAKPVGLGLNPSDTGSFASTVSAIALKRFLPITAGVFYAKYYNEKAEDTILPDYQDYAEMRKGYSYGVAKTRDVLGLTFLNKQAKEKLPGFELLQEIPGLGGLLDDKSAEEFNEWTEEGYESVRSGRYWFSGSRTPFQGGRIKAWIPNWYRRVEADLPETGINLTPDQYFRSAPFPTFEYPLAPLRYLLGHREFEKAHEDDRPYPVSEPYASPWSPFGSLINQTVGRILKKPEYHKHYDPKTGMDKRDLVAAEAYSKSLKSTDLEKMDYGRLALAMRQGGVKRTNEIAELKTMVEGEGRPLALPTAGIVINGENGLSDNTLVLMTKGEVKALQQSGVISSSGQGRGRGNRRKEQELQQMNAYLELQNQAQRELLPGEVEPIDLEGAKISGYLGSDYDNPVLYRTPSGRYQLIKSYDPSFAAAGISPRKAGSHRMRLEKEDKGVPQEILHPSSIDYAAQTQVAVWEDLMGLYGFFEQTGREKLGLGSTHVDKWVLEDPSWTTSPSAKFWGMEQGSLPTEELGSELFRRFLVKPPGMQRRWNPIYNEMPSWMPGDEYFIDYKRGDPYCLRGTTLVEVKGQLVEARHVRVGDQVLTHEGRYQSVTHISTRENQDKMIQLKVNTLSAFPMEVTAGHPILTYRESGTPEWVLAGDIQEGDFVAYPLEQGGSAENILKAFKVVEGGLTPELALVLGYWFGKGLIRKGSGEIIWFSSIKKQEILSQLVPKIEETTGKHVELILSGPRKNWIQAEIRHPELARLLTQLFGKKKALPEGWWNLPREILFKFLKGYYLAAGYSPKGFTRITFKISTPSKAFELRKCLLSLGIVSSILKTIRTQRIKGRKKLTPVYEINVDGVEAEKLGQGSGIPYVPKRSRATVQRCWFRDSNYIYFRVASAVEAPECKRVYSFTVAEDSSFAVAGVITHNSKHAFGEMLLPGAGYEAVMKGKVSTVLGTPSSSKLGMSLDETVRSLVKAGNPNWSDDPDDILSRGTAIHGAIQDVYAKQGRLISAETPVVVDGIVGYVDAIISEDNGRSFLPVEIKSTSAKKLDAMREFGPLPEYEKYISQTNYYLHALNAQKGMIYYVDRADYSNYHIQEVQYDKKRLEKDVQTIRDAENIVKDMLAEGSIKTADIYSDMDRFRVLALTAPYSDQYTKYEQLTRKRKQEGGLGPDEEEEYDRLVGMVRERKQKERLYPYRYKKRDYETIKGRVDKVLSPGTFTLKGKDDIYRLAGFSYGGLSEKDLDAIQEVTQLKSGQKLKMITEGIPSADSYNTIKVSAYHKGENLNRKVLETGRVEKKESGSAEDMDVHVGLQDSLRGRIWEEITHMDTFLHTKFMKVRSPAEEWERGHIYGMNFGGWQDPVRDWVMPISWSLMGKNPIEATLRGAVIGSFFTPRVDKNMIREAWNVAKRTESNRVGTFLKEWATATGGFGPRNSKLAGKLSGGKVGGLIGLGLSLYREVSEVLGYTNSGDAKIPEVNRKKFEIEEYFDKLKFVKHTRLARIYEQVGIENEEGSLRSMLAEGVIEGKENKKKTKKLLKEKKRLFKTLEDERQLGELTEKEKARREEAQKRMAEINRELTAISGQRTADRVGPAHALSLLHRKEARATAYGADPGNWSDVYAALPGHMRTPLLEGAETKDDREQIWKTLPNYLRRLLATRYGKGKVKQESLEEYFSDKSLPGEDWEGWDSDVDLNEVKAKVIEKESSWINPMEMGIWPQISRDADENLGDVPIPKIRANSNTGITSGKLRQLLENHGYEVNQIRYTGVGKTGRVDMRMESNQDNQIVGAIR